MTHCETTTAQTSGRWNHLCPAHPLALAL